MVHLGIDLGTTNSAAAVFDGEKLTLIRNAQGGTLTPSVVRLDARGAVTVGAKARRALDTDPANTRAEFKRLMGTGEPLLFPASGRPSGSADSRCSERAGWRHTAESRQPLPVVGVEVNSGME